MVFPPELIYAFVEWLHDDHQTLANCAQVSHSFLPPARKQLFSHITFDGSKRPFEDFLHFLVENPHIVRRIKSLKLHALHAFSSSDAMRGKKPRVALSVSLLARILAHLPFLHTLQLRSLYLIHTNDAELPTVPVPVLALSALCVDDTRDLLRLLRMLPCKELRLHSLFHPGCPRMPTPKVIAEMADEPCFPRNLEVQHLKLWSSTYYDTPWLLHVLNRTLSLRSVETLDVECSWANHPGPDIRDYVAEIGSNLRSLTLHLRNNTFPLFVTDDFIVTKSVELLNIHACTALTEINLYSPVDRCLFLMVEHVLSRTHGTVQCLNIHATLEVPHQAKRLAEPDFQELYERVQDQALQMPALCELRWTLDLTIHRSMQSHSLSEVTFLDDHEVYQAIRVRMPKLVEKGMLQFGAQMY